MACGCAMCCAVRDNQLSSSSPLLERVRAAFDRADSTSSSQPHYVQSLVAERDSARWNYRDAVGTPVDAPGGLGNAATVTYSFPQTLPDYYVGDAAIAVTNFQPFSTQLQQGARDALQTWSDVANLTFVEQTDGSPGDITFAIEDQDPGVGGYAYYPSFSFSFSGDPSTLIEITTQEVGGDIWIGPDPDNLDQTAGSEGRNLLQHEIGHAIGLKHPFSGAAQLTGDENSLRYTVMAYNEISNGRIYNVSGDANSYQWVSQDLNPATPMVYDIAAAQYLYGANMTTRTGDDTYSWTTNARFFETIWDAGGTDTLDLSNQTLPSIIDLTPGAYSSVAMRMTEAERRMEIPEWADQTPTPSYDGRNNLGIAFGAIIENVRGGSAADMLTGNDANNELRGEGGDDTLSGGAGNDDLYGADGVDSLDGGAGTDRLFGWTGDDRLNGGADNDELYGDAGNDTLDGGAGIDFVGVTGARADYTVTRNDDGSVTVRATAGGEQDLLLNIENLGFTDAFLPLIPGVVGSWHYGTEFDDTITGTAASDGLFGDRGDDTLSGGDGDDYFHVVTGDGTDSLDGGAGNDFAGIQTARAGHTIAQVSDSVFTVTAPDGSVDTLQSVEAIGFTDVYVGLIVQRFTNADGSTWNQGTYRADAITGTAASDGLRGGDGADTLLGGEGGDYLEGEAGNDRLDGGGGNDFAWAGAAPGDVTLAQQADGSVTVTYTASGEVDTLTGVEAVGFTDSSITVVAPQRWGTFLEGSIFGDTLIGLETTDGIAGGAGNDSIDGAGADDFIEGGAGADTIAGGAGNDFMLGGAGADTFVFSGTTGFDRVEDFQAGIDRVQLAAGTNYGFFEDANGTWLSLGPEAGVLLTGVDHTLASDAWVTIG